ncbi:hypothetical protein BGZ76_010930 [Entomortierella beljakovae]|nr:hypothetical protein BGZ76_010930 [Entomortierella beljakovae]
MNATSTTRYLARTKSIHPLYIPEILAIIFSFLSSHSIKYSVRSVSKLWLSVCRPFIDVLVRLPLSNHISDQYRIQIDRLHLATILCIDTRAYWEDFDDDLGPWDLLSNKIDRLKVTNQLHISRLNLDFVVDFQGAIYPILQKIDCLQEIYMTSLADADVYLGTILTLCPNLRLFSVDNYWRDGRRILDLAPPSKNSHPDPESRPNSLLMQLIIRGITIDQPTIQSIIQRCPKLEILRLDQVIDITNPSNGPFNRKDFFQLVARSCRYLKNFHFSLHLQDMNLEDAQSLMEAFFPAVLDKHSIMSENQGSSLDTISLLETEFHGPLSMKLMEPLTTSLFNNTITKVEILPATFRTDDTCIIHALHNLFCSAPSLLELLAPSVGYFTEYLEFSQPIDLEQSYPIRSCIFTCEANKSRFKKKRIWVCHGLQRLQLKFRSALHEDESSPRTTRIVFDYISRVCPNLRELAIYKSKLHFHLEGGLCLLSRLRSLERLVVVSWEETTLKKADLKWMKKHQLEKRTFRNFFKKPNILLNTSKRIPNLPTSSHYLPVDNNSESVTSISLKDLQDLGSLESMNSYLKQLKQGIDSEGCWPRLEYLGIRHYSESRIQPEIYLPRLIEKIRPDVEFSCIYDELIKIFSR